MIQFLCYATAVVMAAPVIVTFLLYYRVEDI
jgi:hypothetical protein